MTDSVNTREIVLDMLMEVNRDYRPSHIVLNQMLMKYQYLENQERRFISRLFKGTLEHMLTLDYCIEQFSTVKISKMKPLIRNVLRMGVYQILYMDNIPDSAACNEAVKLALRRGFKNLKGFVNGVLRNVSRNKESISWPTEDGNPVQYISVMYSIPTWLVEFWLKSFDYATVKTMAEDGLKPRPITIRAVEEDKTKTVRERLENEGVTVNSGQLLDYAMEISGFDYLGQLESFSDGDFVVQDESSMMVAQTAGIKAGDVVIDVCAAPGGKSMHAASKGASIVYSRDLTWDKVERIEENIGRTGLTNIVAQVKDATVFYEDDVQKADVLLADLPCSGLGVIGRKPDIKYQMSLEQMKELSNLQRQILSVVWQYVKCGGTLVYSTCTVNPEENHNNAVWFAKEFPFELLEEKQYVQGVDGCDGFYIAKFCRKVTE